MSKLLIVIAATFLAVTTFFAPAAEAGFNVPIGGAPSEFSTLHKAGCGGAHRRRSRRNRAYLARRLAKRRANAARKARAAAIARAKAKAKAKALAAAKAAAAKEAEVAEATDVEDSSVTSTEEVAEAETDEAKEVAAVTEELGCKKFVPEVGMTVTVPCE